MRKNRTFHRKKTGLVFLLCAVLLLGLVGRLVWLMVFQADYYSGKAEDLHEREREIKAARGKILDANGKVLADNKTVCTISVIHSQITDAEKVIEVLAQELSMDEADVRERVEKVSSIERIKTNVEKTVGDAIRNYNLDGVKVDEDYKRYYPYGSLASKVLGFTGADNQGIIGLEVKYEDVLAGTPGKILTTTDARGVELDSYGESREEPVAGNNLQISLDANLQEYAQQAAEKVMEEKQAERVSVLLMNPQNGEIYACVNVPEFDLNDPYTLVEGISVSESDGEAEPETAEDTVGIADDAADDAADDTAETADDAADDTAETAADAAADSGTESLTAQEKQDLLNQMWRNPCLNDTYEPGSTFKIITMSAGLEEGVVSVDDTFYCPGYKVVEDRRIHCAKRAGHGAQTFVEGAMNSCNPVFIEVGLRLGVENYYKYFKQFGLLEKTGVDLPGEASTIMHDPDDMGDVELATVSFGQSFQITPIQLATTVSALINGGNRVTPHFGVTVQSADGTTVEELQYPVEEGIVSEATSRTVRGILEKVVSEGSGKNCAIEGYSIGGKTATSQTLPRSSGVYISSFLGFAPADDPQILGLVIIHNPQGVYYGGTVAAPVLRDIFENALPYLGIEKTEASAKTEGE